MAVKGIKKTTQERQRIGYRRIVGLLISLVILPNVLLVAVGIVLVALGESLNVAFGVLTLAFVAAVVTGVVLVLVFLRREANLSELQSDFVSKVSHELRTPLAGIRLLVETMERAKGDPAIEEKCIAALSSETARLSALIERLLDWGRMEAGRTHLDLKPVPVEEVIGEAVDAFAPLRLGEDLKLTTEVEPSLPPLFADKSAVVDAIVNLLSNALKYGGTPPVVKLEAKKTPRGIAISVTDNGAGIPAPEHRRIFEKFYRIDDRLSRKREGSGLGLAIVKHIVRAHHGRILVESENGRGSTFRIVLPSYKAEKDSVRLAAAEDHSRTNARPSET